MQDRVSQLESRIRELERRAARSRRLTMLALLTGGVACLTALQNPPQEARPRFTEIDVERLNIVEPDGRLALVLANRPRLPDVIMGGKEHDTGRTGRRGPGMLFFNHNGDECGGLTYSTRSGEQGGYSASAGFSFDQYQNDQVVFLSYADNGTNRSSGLYVVDRPVKPDILDVLDLRRRLSEAGPEDRARMQREMREAQARGDYGATRVFVGSQDRTATVRLKDTRGRDRIRLSVDPQDTPRLEFLDEDGNIIHRIPE